ncbi:unnamed protein product [Cylicocyclus nassatus]|uniref:Uncharacterized protein n=1 Tax=Cylicocyclus nassatus TaxID=53992 RepID=A0AA36H6K3_CYLNA|nr:unnamed protein product [Cylicocyclus nassatus]
MRKKSKEEQLMVRIGEKIENLYTYINAVCWSICAAASTILVMTITFGSVALMSYQSQLKTKDLQPIVISISPKIWDLVKNEEFVSAVMKSFKFPIIKNEEGKLVYRIWDTVIDKVSLNGSEFSFPDMRDGIHLRAENMQFHLSTKAELELWEEIFIWIQLAKRKGEIGAKLENVSLDIKLAWNDFKFAPNITMKCNANVEFSPDMEGMDDYKQQADSIITAKINEEVPQMLTNMINEKINPYLQKLKKLMRKYGIYNIYNVSLETEQDSICVKMKRKE